MTSTTSLLCMGTENSNAPLVRTWVLAAEDAQDVGLCNGAGNRVRRTPVIFRDGGLGSGVVVGHPLAHARHQRDGDLGARGIFEAAGGRIVIGSHNPRVEVMRNVSIGASPALPLRPPGATYA